MSLLRPNTVAVWRWIDLGTYDDSGEEQRLATLMQDGVPALLDPMPAASRMGGDLKPEVEGNVFIQTLEAFIDGLMPAQCIDSDPASPTFGQRITTPGASFEWVDGLTYTLAANGQAAFIDVQPGDVLDDETMREFLVLAVDRYYNVKPNIQVRVQYGRAWL